MLTHTVFTFADASFNQALAFVVGAIFYLGFFVWVVSLVRK